MVQVVLEKQNTKFVRLDGEMSHSLRANAISQFKTNPKIQLFLISLKAGGVGLNLAEASYVFMLDPWWNVIQKKKKRIFLNQRTYSTVFIN